MLDTEALHETPEGIALPLRAAGVAPRALAWLVDLGIRAGVFVSLAMPISLLGEAGQGLLLILMFALMWAYPIAFELFMDGQTPGKRIVGLRVVHANGTPVGFTASLIRNLMRTVDALPFGYAFGFASSVIDAQARRLGDLVAGTLVVHADRRHHDQTIPVVPGHVPALSLPADEQALIVAYAERAPQLSEARRIELASLLPVLTQAHGAQAVQRLLGYANHIIGR
ncbi:MAG TPA: RDD family protein [Patescibacteria group bacterium]|nr:RDD family protein [Patescibacteria group bacterium]